MKDRNSRILMNLNKASYKTTNFKNNKICLFTHNKHFVKNSSSKFLKVASNNQNLDEDDIKNNHNFNIFMKSLLKKDDDNKEISKIHSKKFYFRKRINLNSIKNDSNDNYDNCLSSRNEKNKIYSIGFNKNNKIENRTFNNGELNKNDIQRRSIGLECKIFTTKDNKNSRNSIFTNYGKNTTFQEFDGKMLYKTHEKKYSKKYNKRKKFNSFDSIKKIIPKNLIPKIMFSPDSIKKEKENKFKLMTMKENVLLFLKDKNNKINNKFEAQNSITSYCYTNEKINLSLSKKYSQEIKLFPSMKQKVFNNEKNSIKNIKKSKIFYKNKIILEKFEDSNNYKFNKYKVNRAFG